MEDGNLEIPVKVVFDDSNVEQDMSSLAAKANSSLKRIGSDKTMDELDKSIRKAFDSGVAGADKMLQKFAKNKLSVISLTGTLNKLEKEYNELAKARAEAYSNATSVNEETLVKLRGKSPETKAQVEQYEAAKSYSKEMERQRIAAQLTVQAAQAKLDIEGKLRSYYAEETKFMEQQAKVDKQRQQFLMKSTDQLKAVGDKYGFKSEHDFLTKGYTASGNKTAELKAYEKEFEAVSNKIAQEEEKIKDPIPPESLTRMREELQSVLVTFRSHMEQVHSGFSTEPEIEQIRLLKAELDRLSKGAVKGNFVTGNRYIDPSALENLNSAIEKEQEANQALSTSYEIVKNTAEEYADEDAEVVRIGAAISDNLSKQDAYNKALDATTKTMEHQASIAEDSKPGMFGAPIGDDSSLKKIFSWQRVFTIAGRAVQELGRSIQKLGIYAKNALVNIGKLALTVAKISTGAVLKGISKITTGVLQIRKNIAASLPSMKKILRFLMKYVFGFRSIYFLARKIRSAITEGFKAMAMVDESVNKSISSMMTALNQLKGQIGASFAPLLNVVAPILVQIIDLATQAAVAVGAFLATLTGQHTFRVAVAEQVDYAESLKGTASAAKDAAKAIDEYLSPLDELNRMDAPDDGKKGGGGGAGAGNDLGVTYKEVDVNELGISDFAKRLKEAWLQQNWNEVGKVISEELDTAVIKPITEKLSWKNISSKITKFNTIATGIINGFFKVEETFKDMGTLVGTAISTSLKTINDFIGRVDFAQIGKDFALSVKAAIDEIDTQDVATYFTDKFVVIFDTLNGFLSQMSKDGTFYDIAKKIAQSINGIDWYGIFTSIFTFGSLIGRAFIDAITGFLDGGGFSLMLKEIARAINDSAAKLTPADFVDAAHTIGKAVVTILTDVNTFLGDTKGSFDTLLDDIGTFITELPWEDIFKNSGDIVSKIINALVAVINKISGSLNEIQDNGKSLATNIGIALGEGLANVDFSQMGEAFGLFGEAIIDGIKGAISGTGGVTKIITALVEGFNSANAGDMEALVGAAIWLSVAGKIVEGIGRAIPLVLSANQAIPGGLFGALAKGLGTSVSGGAAGGFTALAGSMSMALPIIGAIVAALTFLVGGLVTFTTAVEDTRNIIQETYEQYIGPIMANITDGWTEMSENFQKVYQDYLQPTVDNIQTQFQELWDNHLKAVFEKAGESIGKVGELLSALWDNIISPFVNFVVSVLAPKVSNAFNVIGTLFLNLVGVFSSGLATTMSLFNVLMDFLLLAFTGDWATFCANIDKDWGDLVANIVETAGAIGQTIANALAGAINTIIANLNSIAGGIESFINGIIDGVNEVNEATNAPKVSKIDIPKIPSVPYLAKGAVIPANQPFLAALGDQKYGRNLEAPEGLIRQIMREELGSAGGAGNNTYHVQATIQRRVLFDTIIDEAKLRQQASGANPFDLM